MNTNETNILDNMEDGSVEALQDESQRFYEVSDETCNRFLDIYNTKSFMYEVKFQFIGDSKLKNVIEVKKIAKEYEYLTGAQVLVKINEELMVERDEDNIIEILFTEQIDRIVSTDKGVKLQKFMFNSNPALIEKYGIDALLRANLIQTLHNEQIQDYRVSTTSETKQTNFEF
jgi:hypothetical protein